MLKVKAKKIDFPKIFNEFMEKVMKSSTYNFGYDDYGCVDEDYYGASYADWWDDYLDFKEDKKNKTKKNRIEEDIEDEKDYYEKCIYFYDDITNKKNKQEYNSLFEFDEFISKEDISISESEILYLMNNNTIHCTSVIGSNGKKYLIVSNSWSSLCFKCDNVSNYK